MYVFKLSPWLCVGCRLFTAMADKDFQKGDPLVLGALVTITLPNGVPLESRITFIGVFVNRANTAMFVFHNAELVN